MPQAPASEEMNVYQNAEARFEIAAKKLGLEQGIYRYLKFPDKELTMYIPVGMDNGQLEVFTGYRVLHSTVRGPLSSRLVSRTHLYPVACERRNSELSQRRISHVADPHAGRNECLPERGSAL
jgi:hypothetical protein